MLHRTLGSLVILALVALGSAAHARSIDEIVALRWSGVSVQPADFTDNGKVVVKQELRVTMDGSSRVTGTLSSTFTLDGSTYYATGAVSGRYDAGTQSLVISVSISRSDALPHGLRWCDLSGSLTFYNDSGRAGHFVLKGSLSVSCGGKADFELIDE